MKSTNLLSKILCLLLFTCISSSSLFAKETTNINADWKFTLNAVTNPQTPCFNDSSWTSINLPHTWNAFDGQDGGNNYYRGIGWYRKKLEIPADFAGKIIYLKIGAANTTATVYVNGQLMGTHTGGYSAFMFDITNEVKAGQENVIAVQVDNSASIICPPLSGDFTAFGGITRNVELITANPVHINPNATISTEYSMGVINVAQSGVMINQANVSEISADVSVITQLKNTTSAVVISTLEINIKDDNGSVVKTLTDTKSIPANDTLTSRVTTNLSKPHLWNGLDNPYLYSVEVNLKVNNVLVDNVVQPLGLRYFSVDPNLGFFLNGESYPLRGICMHDDKKNKGRALSDADRKESIDLLRETGLNFMRLSHYQFADYSYSYLDSLGIICWAEIPAVNTAGKSKKINTVFRKNAASMMYELVRQNYNHPSICFWGLGNEISHRATVNPLETIKQLNMLVKSEDKTRLTTLAAIKPQKAQNWIPDTYSNNRYYGWYYKHTSDFGKAYDKLHKKYPTINIGLSEYGCGANTMQHEYPAIQPSPNGTFHPEEYQNFFHEQHIKMINARPYLWQTSVWAGFDFASDKRNEGSQPGINDKGLITYDRGVKKDAFYLYKANWNKKDHFVYITSRRFTVRTGTSLPVKIYSNCPTVILKVNGKVIGTKTSVDHIFQWDNVAMQLGDNKIEVIGINNNVEYKDSIVWNCK